MKKRILWGLIIVFISFFTLMINTYAESFALGDLVSVEGDDEIIEFYITDVKTISGKKVYYLISKDPISEPINIATGIVDLIINYKLNNLMNSINEQSVDFLDASIKGVTLYNDSVDNIDFSKVEDREYFNAPNNWKNAFDNMFLRLSSSPEKLIVQYLEKSDDSNYDYVVINDMSVKGTSAWDNNELLEERLFNFHYNIALEEQNQHFMTMVKKNSDSVTTTTSKTTTSSKTSSTTKSSSSSTTQDSTTTINDSTTKNEQTTTTSVTQTSIITILNPKTLDSNILTPTILFILAVTGLVIGAKKNKKIRK